MSDIFISYSREDRDRVKPLAEALQKACGWTVWWDPHIPAGKTFDEVIETELDKARCVVVVWSQTSISSRWVKTEAAEGLDRGILVPVKIENVRFPLAFRQIQTEDFSDWKGDAEATVFKKLSRDLSSVIGKPVAEQSAKSSKTIKKPKPIDDIHPKIKTQKPQNKDPEDFNGFIQEPEMVRIQGGKFLMGSPETEKYRNKNEQQHEVFIDDFAIGKFPITFEEFDLFCDETDRKKPTDEGWGRKNRPVINVTWNDAYDYTQWLSKVTGKAYRLTTEAEWEYAARAGQPTAYWWGDQFEKGLANCNGSHDKTTPVDTFKPNPFGLHDMLGNVWEWTGSVYQVVYDGSEKKSAEKEDSGPRVVRGGSWYSDPGRVRSAFRYRYYPYNQYSNVGFRLAQD